VDRYFYFFLSLVVAGIVVAGFSRTVDHFLIHATPPRPVLLWIHGAAFSGWVVFFILQSALVRVRKVSVHRTLGWFGAVLGAVMVTLGTVIAVVMGGSMRYSFISPIRHFSASSFSTCCRLARCLDWRSYGAANRSCTGASLCWLRVACWLQLSPASIMCSTTISFMFAWMR